LEKTTYRGAVNDFFYFDSDGNAPETIRQTGLEVVTREARPLRHVLREYHA
jgi:hypothetical protein